MRYPRGLKVRQLQRIEVKLSINEYAKEFGMPIATIHAKLRAKELDYNIENGFVYINVASNQIPKPKTSSNTLIAFYQKENHQLKSRIQMLEEKIDRLISDKESMLREERERIEHLYQSKDEQLKTVLELINTKLQLAQPITQQPSYHETFEDLNDVEVTSNHSERISLRKYLKNMGLDSEERRKIKRRFASAFGSDTRIFQKQGEFFLDFSKHDYSDLLEL